MKQFVEPARSLWKELCKRPSSENPVVEERVRTILGRVKEGGDEALLAIESELSGTEVSAIEVPAQEIQAAEALVSPAVREAIQAALENISAFHKAQMPSCVRCRPLPE